MNADDIEALLSATVESPQLEFKRSMPWDVKKLAVHIIAMSNLRDGGRIVVGIEDETLERTGVSQEDAATYKTEEMQDQVASRADPHVQFQVYRPVDRSGRHYVVIAVASFEQTPTLLLTSVKGDEGEQYERGQILIRSRFGRPKSAPVERADELRELIELAVSRRGEKLRDLGFVTAVAAQRFSMSPPYANSGVQPYDYDKELGDML